jgi:hypothetical protein
LKTRLFLAKHFTNLPQTKKNTSNNQMVKSESSRAKSPPGGHLNKGGGVYQLISVIFLGSV